MNKKRTTQIHRVVRFLFQAKIYFAAALKRVFAFFQSTTLKNAAI